MRYRNIITLFLVIGIILTSALLVKAEKQKEVVLYTALDQIFSEPIIKDFEKQTGIKVKVVYDTEAAKTTGLVNRLIAEKNNPNADVFWNNEIARSIILKDKGILGAYFSTSAKDIPPQFKDAGGYWTGFAARARVLIYNKNMLSESNIPQSIFDLTKTQWKGRFAMANPLFGTTATHCAALFVKLGDEKAKEFFTSLKENGVVMVPGNSTSRDRVVDGELPVGFTDTDDSWVAMSEGQPVDMVYPDADGLGTLLIPNTVCLIKNCPHPEEAKQLIDFILSKEVEEKLAYSESMQIPLRKDVKKPKHVPDYDTLKVMEVDFEAVAHKLPESGEYLTELFLQ
ncbi:MAG: extracellular solute-binding protein [Candidatus Omnitrophota bacterium]